MNVSDREFNAIVKRPGYGLASAFRKRGIQSQITKLGKGSADNQVHDAGEGSKLEHGAGPESISTKKTTLNYSGQCVVRIKPFKKRLIDPDGNCIKYHLDFLRYIGAIKDDSAKAIRIIYEDQEKVATEAEERCEITVEYHDFDYDNPFITT